MNKIKIELDLFERIIIPGLLPANGSRAEAVTLQYLCERIKITDDEKKEFKVTDQPGANGTKNFFWDPNSKTDKEFELPELEYNLLKKGLDLLDKSERLNIKDERIINLFDKVMTAKGEKTK
jgi:hypothetical protein